MTSGTYFHQPPLDSPPPPLRRPQSGSLEPRELFPENTKIPVHGPSSDWCGLHTRFNLPEMDPNLKDIRDAKGIHYQHICSGYGKWEKGEPDYRRDGYLMYEKDYTQGKSETITLSRGVGRTRGWGESSLPSIGQVIIGYVPTQEKRFMGEGTRRGISVIGRVERIFNYQEEKDKFEEKEKQTKEILEKSGVDVEFSKGPWDVVNGRWPWMDRQLERIGSGSWEAGIVVRPFTCVPFKEPIIIGKGNVAEETWAPQTPCNLNGERNEDVIKLYQKMKKKNGEQANM